MTEIPRKLADPPVRRLLDRAAAVVLLAAASPLLAVLAWLVRRSSPGPALLAQERIGLGGKPFRLYKLRTLPLEAAGASDRCWAADAPDPAMRFLRRTGLDELPQLWNVVKGEMALVGPRPERPYFVRKFTEELPDYAERHRIRGGITGWAQIHGLRGDTSVERRLEYDLWYLRNRSAGLDLRILARTVVALARAATTRPGAPPARRSSWPNRSTSWTT